MWLKEFEQQKYSQITFLLIIELPGNKQKVIIE